MVLEGLRAYLQLATGLTDVTKERARAAARALLSPGEGVGAVLPSPVRDQVSSLAEDLVATSKANRDLLVGLVRTEVDRSISRLGLATAADLAAATRRQRRLEDRVHDVERAVGTGRAGSAAKEPAARKTSQRKATTRKATAHKAPTKKSVAPRAADAGSGTTSGSES